MNYEKKYKETLERARIWQEHLNESGDKDYAEELSYIFPKLKKSEDEKIRKALIRFHKSTIKVDGIKGEDIIAWLEKQGEQKAVDSSQICKMEMLMTLDEAIEHCKKKSCDDTACGKEHKQLAEWLTELKVYRGSVAQEAQKAVDKVEPKFKVKYAGGEYNVFEIKDIAGVTYYGIEDEPNHIDYVQAENCERVGSYSIKENGCSFPTKPIMFSEQKSADSYCQKNYRGFQETGKCFADGECKAKREAESTDKVEQSSINEIEIPFGAKDSELQQATYYIPKGFYAEIDDDKVVIKKGEKLIEWSEDDEHRVKDTIYFLDTAKKHYASAVELDACIDWIKSLEDRVQPKQEWSAEDNSVLKDIKVAVASYWDEDTENIILDWLKSLKQRIGG